MQEPSEHVVNVVDSLLYHRSESQQSGFCSASSVSSMEQDDFSLLPVTPTLVSKRKKKRSASKRLLNDSACFSPIGSGGDESSTTTAGDEEWESSDTVVAKLRRELTTAQMELDVEKSNRKKREKTLVRLAKELNKRIAQDEKKDKHIAELQETIDDLTLRLQAKTDLARVELPKLRAELEQKTRELQERIATESTTSSGFLSLRTLFVISVCSAAVAMRFTRMPSWKHLACAAVPPGMVIETTTEPFIFHPPFWVPSPYKKKVHSALCSHTPYTTLRVGQSKLVLINEESKKSTHFKAPGGIQVGLDTIELLDKKDNKRTIPTPWSM